MDAIVGALTGALRAIARAPAALFGRRGKATADGARPDEARWIAPPGQKTRVVDPGGSGDHRTIGEAIAAADEGDRIVVRPGTYQEGLVLDRPLEVVGEGDPSAIVVEAKRTSAIRLTAATARVANLRLVATGPSDWATVEIQRGRPEVTGCQLTGETVAVVAIRGGADPLLSHNRIGDGTGDGVLVSDGGRGTLEDNEVTANAGVGVRVTTGGDPTLRRNRIHGGRSNGVYVDGARGLLEDNDIFDNSEAEVAITTNGTPHLRRNRIHDGIGDGVSVWHHGGGVLEDNEVYANAGAGVVIRSGAAPTLRRNRVNRNAGVAVRVQNAAGGTLEENDLSANAGGAWDVAPDCEANLKRAGNTE
jgi:F-box protein 11